MQRMQRRKKRLTTVPRIPGKQRLQNLTFSSITVWKKDVSTFQGVHLNDIPIVENLLQLNIFLYDIDFVDGKLIGELCRRSIQKYENSVKLLRYNNHICYMSTTSMHCSKLSGVLRAIHFFQRRGIWNDI